MAQSVTIGQIPTSAGVFGAAFSDVGLGRLTFPDEPFENCMAWARRWLPGATVETAESGADARLADLTAQLSAYFAGERIVFTVPLDLRGTEFQVQVWRALLDIAYGEVRSYAQIAAAIGRPTAVRAVGAANGVNPAPIVVPCHRVIGANGSLTGYGGGIAMKERLLQREGVRLGA